MAIAEVVPVVQRTPEWVEAREHGVGASEAAAAVGLSRWESPYSLWARKLNLVPPPESSLAMEIGTATEALNAARYEAETGARVRRVNQLRRSRRHPFLLASLDRRRPDDGRLVELKWTERGEGYGEPGSDEVPDEVLCQAIQQMAVTGAPAVDVSVLFGGRRHAIYTIERDLEAEAALVDQVAGFWRHVEERTEPPADGSEATRRALAARYPRDNGTELEADDQLAALLVNLRLTRRSLDLLTERREAYEAQIKAAMAEAAVLVAPGVGRITWKAAKDSTSTDWRAVAEAYRLIAEAAGTPAAELDGIHEDHMTTKPGARRFLSHWEEETDG